jgi:hypothetical protein
MIQAIGDLRDVFALSQQDNFNAHVRERFTAGAELSRN